jgi:hypothetical protein
MENHGGMIPTSETTWFVHQSSLAFLPAVISSKQEEQAKEVLNLALRTIFVHTSKVIFYMP